MAIESKLRAKGKYFNKKLKAKEVLRLYESGERDFQGVILRGQSFKGQDLSGADFSEAKLCSTNFENTKLLKCNFNSIRCKTRWHYKLLQILLLIITAVCFGLISIFPSLIIRVCLETETNSSFLSRYEQVNPLIHDLIMHIGVFLGSLFFSSIIVRKGISKSLLLLQWSILPLIISILLLFISNLFLYLLIDVNLAYFSENALDTVFVATFSVFTVVFFATVFLIPSVLVAAITQSIVIALVKSIAGKFVAIIAASLGFIYIAILLLNKTNKQVFPEESLMAGNVSIFVIFISTILIVIAGVYNGLRAVDYKDRDLWISRIAIKSVTVNGTNFCNANLTDSSFFNANLKSADFRESNLTGVSLYGAKMLDKVELENTYLEDSQIRRWVIGKGTNKDFNGKDLRGVNLQGADLTNASFINTDLSNAILSETTLTGACILDWNINNKTKLNDVICDYVYLDREEKERRPSDPNKIFKPGDFANLVQKSLSTVDLIFSEGIDWQGFLDSFKKLQVEDGNGELVIQAIERKTNGAFVVRVEVPPDADKASIEESFWQKYNPTLEAKDREIKLLSQQTEFYSQQVEVIRKDNTRLLSIVETMAEKESIKVQQNFNAPVSGVAGNIEGNQIVFTSNNLIEASTEIQNLLTSLQNNGLTQEQAEGIVANNLATQVKDNPTLKGKLVNWGKSLGNKAAETSVSEIARRVIKLALNLAGVPMP